MELLDRHTAAPVTSVDPMLIDATRQSRRRTIPESSWFYGEGKDGGYADYRRCGNICG
jgi:hypothetical protein